MAEHKRWEFESDETSSGVMFSVYDEYGNRLTEPYISEPAARLIAAAPDLLAALEDILADRLASLAPGSIDRVRAAIHLAKHGSSQVEAV